ncbi:methionyl-tRNA formyltransferase, mitochondrial [Athalia rosae]|uniref:methionyl-tRNA formyltransferase, mitochondrial n=1 Tax=Athalia rosae TaxID=37344 RepID=UPI002033D7C6|nr:methionyl-tRNA formyltransferase, mitochondrial [Athalia rosae]
MMLVINNIKHYGFRASTLNLTMTNRIFTRIQWHRQILSHVKNISAQAGPPWSVLFFGTDDFALQSLKLLYTEYETRELLCRLEVVTSYHGKENHVTKFAKQHHIQLHHWPPKISLDNFHIGLVVSFGHLIPLDMISSFPLGMLNVHGSLLPRWRGAAPIIYTLMNGDSETGVSIMKIMPKVFDIGEVLAQSKIEVRDDETMPELRTRMSQLGANLLLDTVRKLPNILESAKPQSNDGITYAPRVTSKLSLVKWNEMTAKRVFDLYRALYDLYPLTTKFMGLTIKLLEIELLKDPPLGNNSSNHLPGLVMYSKDLDRLVVHCRDNSWITVGKIGYPGRPPMSARDFHNGFLYKNKQKKSFFEG